jgi:hypothetical protein
LELCEAPSSSDKGWEAAAPLEAKKYALLGSQAFYSLQRFDG